MPRTVAVIVLLLVFTSVIGFVLLGVRMKMAGYPDSEYMRWFAHAVFLRTYGLWMIPISVVWGCCAWAADRRAAGPNAYRVVVAVGVMLALIVPASFVAAAIHPGYSPITIYKGE